MKLKKILLPSLIILLIIFIFGTYLLLIQNSFTRSVKDIFPNNFKYFLKETVFIIPNLKKENKILKEKYELLEKDFTKFKIGSPFTLVWFNIATIESPWPPRTKDFISSTFTLNFSDKK